MANRAIMTFGVEVECYIPVAAEETPSQARAHLNNEISPVFDVKVDNSYNEMIPAGYTNAEVICRGPMIAPNCLLTSQNKEALKTCLNTIRAYRGGAPTRKAGLHVHVGTSLNLLPTSVVRKSCMLYTKYEKVLDLLIPPTRRGNYEYAKSVPEGALRRLMSTNDIRQIKEIMNPGGNRYYKVNLQNIKPGGIGTIEFRGQASSTKYENVGNWTRLMLRLVKVAVEDPQSAEGPAPADIREAVLEFEQCFIGIHSGPKLQEWFWKRLGKWERPAGWRGQWPPAVVASA